MDGEYFGNWAIRRLGSDNLARTEQTASIGRNTGLALERQDIEKRDFPIGRRGYDPDAVDRHLREIAAAVEELRAQAAASAASGPSLAATASEQVRSIVDAAESSASGITREADARAEQIRQEAADESDRARADAAQQAREHVAQVSEATAVMIKRVDAMEGELGALVESLRTGANRLNADLALLQGNMGDLRTAATGSGEAAVVEEAVEEDAAIAAEPEPEPDPEPEPEPEPEPGVPFRPLHELRTSAAIRR